MNSDFAKTLIPLIDLTRLNEDDTPETIEQLCHQAKTSYGPVAAVCIYPQFVKQARFLLAGVPIKVATVANFPKGDQSRVDCIQSIKQSLDEGADEIDLVMPYKSYLEGNTKEVRAFLEACRGTCGPQAILKVILETGALIKRDIIFDATKLAIHAGADFIKTSTGKLPSGATIEAAEIILEAIQNHANKRVGLKISGGIQTFEQAVPYIQLIKDKMGAAWITPQTIRFGASRLLADIMQCL
ncbi:deoxyribose-phosphate aldolase [Coxiella burnetii]|uniref:deoxyribose-phosphate aldolase n=1 Tax=Coxiella burnetii TaxID=777 RepID=UPI000183D101|nr:deoxyribose-phosphate aldolase [Coxiella burnetii]ACJ17723.1 deoxyribose-phosphate aldolase [Coxiella burnetii CbuG_Q212]ATN66169.1 2-deoxyribose-5-phosphate aldolase [Coxiella burnetii]OYK86873.1 2-deoxyribose-5-phosphate aldolase [Coxiella burnetii]